MSAKVKRSKDWVSVKADNPDDVCYHCNKKLGRAVGTKLNKHTDFVHQLTNLRADRTTVSRRQGQSNIVVPDQFNGLSVWKNYIPPVRDQGTCGACWAITSTDVLSMRLAIYTKGNIKKTLSPAAMLLCNLGSEYETTAALESLSRGDPYDTNPARNSSGSNDTGIDEWIKNERRRASLIGCGGDTLISAWQYLARFGSPTETCVPYNNIKWKDELAYVHRPFSPAANRYGSQAPAQKQVFNIAQYDATKGGSKSVIVHQTDIKVDSKKLGSANTTPEDDSYPYFPSCTETLGFGYDMCSSDKDTPMKLYPVECFYIVPGTAEMSKSANFDVAGSEQTIRREIYHFGPVSTGFAVQASFMDWDGLSSPKVWENTTNEPDLGGHSVVLMGWGSSTELGDYWICRNSWGGKWGHKGYFYMRRGTNNGGIEENVVVGIPEIPGLRLVLDWPTYFDQTDYFMKHVWHVGVSGYKCSYVEKALMGKVQIPEDISKPIIPPECWPDFSILIAAEPDTVKFPFTSHVHIGNYQLTKQVGLYALAGLITVGTVYYIMKHKRKN